MSLKDAGSQLFRQMWKRLKRGNVILGDRGFGSYATLANLLQRGVDSVRRLHHARKVDFREGRRLGADDRLVLWRKPQIRSPVISDEQWAALPETLPVRLIRLQVAAPGFRTRTVVLVTTLLESQTYPAAAIRALYGERWQVELHFHQIKTLMAILRCKTPDLIEKELLIHLIAYNLVRVLMQRSAPLHHVPLSRISFKGTFDTARHFADVIHAASDTPRRQQKLIDEMLALIAADPVPLRPGRSEPAPRNDGQKTISFSPNPAQRWAMSHTATAPIQNVPNMPYLGISTF